MKHKMLKHGLAGLLALAMAFTTVSAVAPTQVQAVTKSKTTAKTMVFVSATQEYQVGAAFKKDAKVTVTFMDDSGSTTGTVSGSQLTYEGDFTSTDMRTIGTHDVTLKYGDEATATYSFEVKPKLNSLTITTKEDVQNLTVGDTYNFNGTVTAKYGDGSEEDVTGDLTYTDADTSYVGSRYVTLNYKYCGDTKTVKNNVLTNVVYSDDTKITLNNIKFTKEPTKVYNVGGTFSFDGTATAVFSDGGERDIIGQALTVSSVSTDKTANEKQTVTVSFTYRGVTRSLDYEITVNGVEKKDLTGLSFSTNPTKNYLVGDSFSFDGAVSATYSNGDTAPIDKSLLTISTPDMSTAGTKGVTVSYTEKGITQSLTYNIVVTKPAPTVPKMAWKSISNKKAKKLTLKWKRALDVTGYQIQYATNSSMSGAKNKWVRDADATSVTLTKLTSGKTYYVRMRAYITQDGTKYYSKWTTKKSRVIA